MLQAQPKIVKLLICHKDKTNLRDICSKLADRLKNKSISDIYSVSDFGYCALMNVKAVTLFFLAILAPFSYAKSGDILACIDDHPPYQVLAEKPYGTHISALEILANVLDKKLIFIRSTNFARCVALLKSGEVDVIAGLNINDERKQFAFYAPFKYADERIVISTKDIHITDYQDFTGKIIGIPRGTTYFKKFDEDTSLNKVSIHTIRTGLELLRKKRIDMIITSAQVVNTLVGDINKDKLKISRISLVDDNKTFFGFSKKNKLNLTSQDVIKLTTKAFEAGAFDGIQYTEL